jgi:hypothetical protein
MGKSQNRFFRYKKILRFAPRTKIRRCAGKILRRLQASECWWRFSKKVIANQPGG